MSEQHVQQISVNIFISVSIHTLAETNSEPKVNVNSKWQLKQAAKVEEYS